MIPHDAGSCSDLLPPDWIKGVVGAEIPNDNADVGDWETFGNSQTANLDTSNDHYKQGVGIVKRCEDRDKAVTQKLTAPWWKLWAK